MRIEFLNVEIPDMATIAMCQNDTCPRKNDCYRYMAEPGMWQSYAEFPGGEDCEYFIEVSWWFVRRAGRQKEVLI